MNAFARVTQSPLRVTTAQACVAALLVLVVLFVLLVSIRTVFAAAPAGSIIRNQASATYLNAAGVERFTTSNIVETIVNQAAALELAQSQNKLASSGGTVSFPHVLTNTGNGPDQFLLSINQLGGDDFDYLGVSLFADNDQNGIADNATPINRSPVLKADDTFSFVVVANVPAGLTVGNTGDINVTATSTFNSAQTVSNQDSATVSGGALIDVSKSMNITQGSSPSGPYTVTLSYTNNGASAASNVTLIDALPLGMSYVPNSARWSLIGAVVLTDSNPTDLQGVAPNAVRFCAYDASCTGLAEASRDADTQSTNQITAILAEVVAGGSGSLTFDVTIDAGIQAGDLLNAAEFEYENSGAFVDRVETNVVAFRVSQATGVVANGSITSNLDGANEPVNIATAFQGSTVEFRNVIWNTGNDTDIIDIIVNQAGSTFPDGTVQQLFRGDSRTPLLDSNGNGLPDTGPIDPGANFPLILQTTLNPGAVGNNGGAGYQISITARSTNDPNTTNTIIDSLDTIVPSAIDLTNAAATGTPGALGEGPGVEADAVLTNVIAPGNTTRFTLFITNIGNTPDEFAITASTDSSFTTQSLPDGWSVNFRNLDNTVDVTNSGTLIAGDSIQVFADISVPADQGDVVQDIFFRASSPVTGGGDIIYNAVEVVGTATLALEPSGTTQIEAGGATVYSHRLENTSTVPIGPINVSSDDSIASSGWTSIVFEDTDNDGVFTSADQPVNVIASLPAGGVRILFVRVASPSNAPDGVFNITTLEVSENGSTVLASVENVTTIASGDIVIVKEQAPDIGCDGTLDGSYSAQSFSLEPGNNCVRYRLTATNAGVEPVFNAIIQDATPPFTIYEPAAVCSATSCVIVEPGAGGTGAVSGEVARINPGESVALMFAVIIE